MRTKGIIGLLVVVAIIGAVFYFLSDKFIENTIEELATDMLGAQVEIDNLDFSLAGLSISMDRLQATNPNDTWKNLFETGRLAFDMEVAPLARKKINIKEVTVADIRLGTKRQTDGKLEKPKAAEEPGWFGDATAGLKKQVVEAPVLNLGILKKKVNVDSLLSAFDIQTLRKIDSARKDADATFNNWDKTLAEFRPQEDLAKIAKDIEALKAKKVSNASDLLSAAEKSRGIIATLNALKKDVAAKKKAATSDLRRVSTIFSEVDNWLADDFNSIKAKANIGEFSAQNIGTMLFGEVVVNPVLQWLGYINMGRKYMPIAQKFMASGKVEKPPRFAGQNIKFPLLNNQPEFLLENILVSAATNQDDTSHVLSLSGEMHGITSQPKVYGSPLTFALNADMPGSNSYNVSGELDHTGEEEIDRFRVTATGVRLGNIALPEKPYLPNRIAADTGNITATLGLVGDKLDVKIEFKANPVKFDFADAGPDNSSVFKMTRSVFDSIDELTFVAGISGSANNLSLKISSNIDAILAERIKGVVGESARLARSEIHKKLVQQIAPRKQAALTFVSKNKARITGELDRVEQSIDEQLQVVNTKLKEVEAEINNKKDQGVKDVKDKLKGLFKKKKN